MYEKHYIRRKENTDLNVYRCGVEACTPGHAWGPGVRDHYLVHVIRSGHGTLVLAGRTWRLGAGDGFMVPPEVPVFWQADETAPWQYAWLTPETPVFRHDRDDTLIEALDGLIAAAREEAAGSMTTPGELLLTGHLFLFLSRLTALLRQTGPDGGTAADKERHVRKALAWLERHYPEDLHIQDMAHALGLDRSYLSTLIRRQTGKSPQAHLIGLRMERAAYLMGNPQLSIADIARSVGYDDPAQFSKTFRQTFGQPPLQSRKAMGQG